MYQTPVALANQADRLIFARKISILASGRLPKSLTVMAQMAYSTLKRKRYMQAFSKLAILKTRVALVIGVAAVVAAGSAIALPGTFGAFTAQTSNPDNLIVAGTVQMDNSHANGFILQASNAQPGDIMTGTVNITNTGSLNEDIQLTESAPTSTPSGLTDAGDAYSFCNSSALPAASVCKSSNTLGDYLTLKIVDCGRADSPNTPDCANGTTVYDTAAFESAGTITLDGSSVHTYGSPAHNVWVPGESHEYQLIWTFPNGSPTTDNVYQGAAAQATFTFNGIQVSPNDLLTTHP